MNEKATGIMTWVMEHYPEAIVVEPDNEIVRHLTLCESVNSVTVWDIHLLTYGIVWFLSLMEYYKVTEEYEKLAIMRDTIVWINKCTTSNYPSDMSDERVKEYVGVSPGTLLGEMKMTDDCEECNK